MLDFIKEVLKGDNGSYSSRRVGYMASIATMCAAAVYLCGLMGWIVITNPQDGAIDMPQLVTSFVAVCGILSGAVTAGYVMKKGDGNVSGGDQE